MKTLIPLFTLSIILIVFSCKKDDPVQQPQPQPINNNNNGGGNTTSNNDSLAFEFVVTSDIPSNELDSVVIIHYQYSTYTELGRVTIPASSITLGNFIIFSALSVNNPPSNNITLTGDDSFAIYLYLNSTTDYSADTNNRFEFGYNSPYSTASGILGFNYVNGLGVVSGYGLY